MAEETKNYNLKFTLDDSQFQSKARNVAVGVTGINQALELLQKTYRSIASAAEFAGRSIERGADVADVEQAFDRLANKAGTTAEVLKKDLNEAALNTVSNFDLMRKANEQLRAGLKPDELVAVSKAAKQFADEDGKDFIETMDQMAKSLIRGDDRALKNLGVIIDNKKAYAEFAKEIGTTAEKLNELGKAQAIREAAAKELTKRTEELGQASQDAGDKVNQLKKAFYDAWNEELKTVAQSEEVNRLLEDLIDLAPKAAHLISELASAFAQLTSGVTNFSSDFGRGLLVLRNYFKEFDINQPIGEGLSAAIKKTQQDMIVLAEAAQETRKPIKEISGDINSLSEWMEKNAKSTKATTDGFIDAGKGAEEAAKKFAELKESIAEMGRDATGESLGSAIKESIENLDYETFSNLKEQILANARAGLMEGIKDAMGTSLEGEALANVQTALNNITIDLNQQLLDKGSDTIQALEDAQKEAFQNSVDFFEDIFSQVIEDGSLDFERMLKQVAVGFASTLAAGLLNIQMPGGGLGGLGSALASSLLGGGGGSGGMLGGLVGGAGIGSLLGGTQAGGFIAGMGGTIGPVASGAEYSGMLAAGAWNPYILAGGAALAIGSQTNWFGLGGGMSAGQKERGGIRDKIAGMAGGGDLRTQFGSSDLFNIDFKQFDESIPILEDARKAVEGLTLALTGGGEQSDEFSKIFAQLVAGFEDGTAKAASQNDILFATKEVMAQLGLTTDEAKGQLLGLFKEGKLSAEQFSEGISSLNDLAREDLIGDGSIADAVKILVQSIEKDPAAALKAFELSFKEAAEVAGNQLGTVQDFFVQVFGQDAIAVFDQLRAAGITTWQDIANASVDQIALIFQALTSLGIQADQVMAGIASATVNPQGGAAVPGAASAAAPSSGSGRSSAGGGTRGETEAQKRAKKQKELAKERLRNKRMFDELFGGIEGSLGGTGGLDDALLGLLGGGSQFSISQIAQALNSSDFLGLGAGAGQFAQNLLTGLGGRAGTALAPLSTEVEIDQVLSSLNRSMPADRTFGPAAQLISRARADLQGRAFRGQERISIADVQGLLGSGGDLLSGFTSLFGQQDGQQASNNLNSFASDVVSDLRRSAGGDLIDIENLRSLMTEAEDITRESFIKPLQDARGEMMELFENSSRRGVKRFIEETDAAIKRLKDIRTELKNTAEKADGLLGKLGQVGQTTRSRKNTSVNNLNAAA